MAYGAAALVPLEIAMTLRLNDPAAAAASCLSVAEAADRMAVALERELEAAVGLSEHLRSLATRYAAARAEGRLYREIAIRHLAAVRQAG